MLSVSEILLQHQSLSSFERLLKLVRDPAYADELFLEFDVRPPFPDTPENWQDQLEAAFTAARNFQN